jgi:hypothetical protein
MYVFSVQSYGQKERKKRNETVEYQNSRGEGILIEKREIVQRLCGLNVVTLFVGDLTTYKIRVSEDMSRCYAAAAVTVAFHSVRVYSVW